MSTAGQRHADLMDADGFWRQFVTAFYFEQPLDEIIGAVVHYWPEGRGDDAIPVLRLQTKEGRRYDVTAGAERLKFLLCHAAPARGDWVKIVYVGEAPSAARGYNKAKLFTVEVKRPKDSPPRDARNSDQTSGEVKPLPAPEAGKTT